MILIIELYKAIPIYCMEFSIKKTRNNQLHISDSETAC